MGRTIEIETGARRRARWPWALAAVGAGAAAGAVTAYVLRQVDGEDRPGALEPEELRAVVDHDARRHDSPRHD